MNTPLLATVTALLTSTILGACGGDVEVVRTPDDERVEERAEEDADRAADKADRAAEKAEEAAEDAQDAEERAD